MTMLHTLSEETLAILREADRALFALPSANSHYPLYHLLRVTCQQLALVDSFYVGFFCPGEAAMVFPYSYDGEEYDDPEKAGYAPDGITAWMVEHQAPYWAGMDGGTLLRRGKRFGDMTRRSADTVVVPLLRPGGLRSERLLGLMGVLTYVPDSYTDGTVTALQWLAGSLATLLSREQEDATRRGELGGGVAKNGVLPASPADLVGEISAVLQGVRRRADAMRSLLPGDTAALNTALDALCQACEQGQTDVTERLLATNLSQRNPLSVLSEAERRVLPLLVAGKRDREISDTLCLSPHTVKSHCRSILRKLGASNRDQAVEIARPWLDAPYDE